MPHKCRQYWSYSWRQAYCRLSYRVHCRSPIEHLSCRLLFRYCWWLLKKIQKKLSSAAYQYKRDWCINPRYRYRPEPSHTSHPWMWKLSVCQGIALFGNYHKVGQYLRKWPKFLSLFPGLTKLIGNLYFAVFSTLLDFAGFELSTLPGLGSFRLSMLSGNLHCRNSLFRFFIRGLEGDEMVSHLERQNLN